MENIGFNAEGMALNNSIRKRNVALAYNGFGLGEVRLAECSNLVQRLVGGILPNHCYKPFISNR